MRTYSRKRPFTSLSSDPISSSSSAIENAISDTPPSSPPPAKKPRVALSETDGNMLPLAAVIRRDEKDSTPLHVGKGRFHLPSPIRVTDLSNDREKGPGTREVLAVQHSKKKNGKVELKTQQKRYTQMKIDLGQKTLTTCSMCDMQYHFTEAEDCEQHKRFCELQNLGIPISDQSWLRDRGLHIKDFFGEPLSKKKKTAYELYTRHDIWRIARGARRSIRKTCERALRHAEEDMGAVPTTGLWDSVVVGKDETRNIVTQGPPSVSECRDGIVANKYWMYVYVVEERIIGVALVERIHHAHWRLDHRSSAFDGPSEGGGPSKQTGASSQQNTNSLERSDASPGQSSEPIELSQPESMGIGIARIWVLRTYRRRKVAKRLLSTILEREAGREQGSRLRVAFSQLTTMGEGLARSWTLKKNEADNPPRSKLDWLLAWPEGETVWIYDERGCYK